MSEKLLELISDYKKKVHYKILSKFNNNQNISTSCKVND